MKRIIALVLAVLMVAALFVGCQKKQGEIPTLKWYTVGSGMPDNYKAWQEKFNAYLEDKIGVHVDIECVGWGDWANRRSAIVSTNEPYDIMFTAQGDYGKDVNMGAFADLTDMLADYPGLTKVIPESVFEGVKINGRIYAIPAYKDSSMTNFLVWDKAHVDAYCPEYTEVHTFEDLDKVLPKFKDTGVTPIIVSKDGINPVINYDNFGSCLPALGINIMAEGAPKVVPVFEQPDTIANAKFLQSWMEKGFINSDAATLGDAAGMAYTTSVAQGWPFAAKTTWGPQRNIEAVTSQWYDTILSNDTIQGSMLCISNSSEHKAEAMKLIELINTDTIVRDALFYGEEGVNFEYVGEGDARRVKKLNSDWKFAGYTQGTFFNLTLEEGTEKNYFVEEVKVQNENAVKSPALGFYFDTTSVQDQLSACIAIYMEYKPLLNTGTGDAEQNIAEMMGKMRDAGFDAVQAEAQKQLDAWLAAK